FRCNANNFDFKKFRWYNIVNKNYFHGITEPPIYVSRLGVFSVVSVAYLLLRLSNQQTKSATMPPAIIGAMMLTKIISMVLTSFLVDVRQEVYAITLLHHFNNPL